jgi:hypothetical protein
MSLATDIIDRSDRLVSDRSQWEKVWSDCARYGLPMGDRFSPFTLTARRQQATAAGGGFLMPPTSADHGKEIYDSTAVMAIDRLTAGLESLVTPSAYDWHELTPRDPFAQEVPQDQEEYLETLNRFMRQTRDDPACGWGMANQSAIRSMNTFGTGVYYIYEGYGTNTRSAVDVPIMYQYVPLSDAYLGVNSQGQYDTCARRYFMTARQVVQMFGNGVHPKVRAMANNKDDQDRAVEIVHACWPRENYWQNGLGAKSLPFGSWYVDVENRHVMREGGRRRFPYVVYNWNREAYQPYGESPLMLALAEIKSMQVMQRSTLQGVQQMTRPPLLMSSDGLMNRPNLNAGAVNMGGVDANGRPRIMPLVTSQFSTAVVQVMEGQKNSLRELLYLNLWSILIQNPKMTATEALIRAQEKGDLLSPVGLKIQSALSDLIDIEFDIYAEKDAFAPGSMLAPPASLEGKQLQVKYASPLDKLRRAAEVQGINDTLAMATQIAAVDQSILDYIDMKAALDIVRDVRGAPAKIFRSDEEVAAIKQEKAQAQAAAGAATLGVEAGQAMENVGRGALALKQAQDMIAPTGI